MIEKRKSKRLPASMELEVSSLFKQDYVRMEKLDAPVTITNISRGGLGFISESVLPEDFYFNACIKLGEGEDNKLYCVIKILRREQAEHGYLYGCEMVGFPPVLSYIFDDYEKQLGD